MTKFLEPDRILTKKIGKYKITIKQKITPDGARATKNIASYIKKGDLVKPNKKLNDGTGKPKAITVHNTETIKVPNGTTPAEQYARATYPNGNMGGIAVHFWVYKNEIWQQLDENERGWHAADGSTRRKDHRGGKTGGNIDTIAIECIESGSDKETEDTLAKLVAYLCDKYNLDPKYDIYTHNYWMHGVDKKVKGVNKNCPYYILPHWNEFLFNVQKYYDLMNNISEEKEEINNTSSIIEYKKDDIVIFSGNIHYTSSYKAGKAKKCKPGRAIVTKVVKNSINQPHNIAIKTYKDDNCTVNGWVNPEDIVLDKIEIGDLVICKEGVTKYSNGRNMPSWVIKTQLYVRDIEKNGTIYLVSTEKTKKVYTGRIKAIDVEKVY